MSFLISKKVVNSAVEMIKADLPALLNTAGLKLEHVKKGKHKVLSLKNSVFISNRKRKPDGLLTYYYVEIYYNVTHEDPEKLEDMINDFGDCLSECLKQNPTLNGQVSDSNEGDGYYFISDNSIHTAIGKLDVEVSI